MLLTAPEIDSTRHCKSPAAVRMDNRNSTAAGSLFKLRQSKSCCLTLRTIAVHLEFTLGFDGPYQRYFVKVFCTASKARDKPLLAPAHQSLRSCGCIVREQFYSYTPPPGRPCMHLTALAMLATRPMRWCSLHHLLGLRFFNLSDYWIPAPSSPPPRASLMSVGRKIAEFARI